MRLGLVAAVGAALVGGWSLQAATGAGPTGTYSGQFVGDGKASITVDVSTDRRGKRRFDLIATGTPVFCEGDITPVRLEAFQLNGKFSGRHHFEGRVRQLPQEDGLRSIFKVGGTVSGGVAKGFAFYWREDHDPPAGSENYAECSTAGLLRWTATKAPPASG